jgi:hypothetical protein
MFPDSYGKPLECGNRSRQTFLKAMDVWSEYAACRSPATFRPEAVEEFEAILCRAIEDSFEAALEQIKAHREGPGAADVFREIQQIFGDVCICAGYLLGHVHGVERNLKDRTARLDEIFRKNPSVEDFMNRLERILHELWLQEFVWPSIEVFAPIYDLICEMMSHCGLVFAKPLRSGLCQIRGGMEGRDVRGPGSSQRGPQGFRPMDQVLCTARELDARRAAVTQNVGTSELPSPP